MALTFYGTKFPRGIFDTIQNEIYALTPTINGADGLGVSFTENHTSGTEFTNVKLVSALLAYDANGIGIAEDAGTIEVGATNVTLVKQMTKVTYDPNTLLNTRFELDIKGLSLNPDSATFKNSALDNVIKNDAGLIENAIWSGATAATKAAVAAAVVGTAVAQYTAGEKAMVAAMATAQMDSVVASLVYNNNQDKTTQAKGTGKGDYNVANITPAVLTSANISTKLAEVFASQFAVNSQIAGDKSKPMSFIVNYGAEALIAVANNPSNTGAVAAAQLNFANNAGQWSYNGINIYFRNVPTNVILLGKAEDLHILTDSKNDAVSGLKIDRLTNFSDKTGIQHIFAFATFVSNGKYFTAHLI